MKNLLVSALVISSSIASTSLLPTTTALAETASNELRISCGQAFDPSSKSAQPATVASIGQAEEGVTLIIWKSEAFAKFSPQKRCEVVSPKIQAAIQAGRAHIVSGQDSTTGLGIICAVANRDDTCDNSQMLFTLKSYQNADSTVEQLAYILSGKTNVPIYQNSGRKYVANLLDLLKIRRKN